MTNYDIKSSNEIQIIRNIAIKDTYNKMGWKNCKIKDEVYYLYLILKGIKENGNLNWRCT